VTAAEWLGRAHAVTDAATDGPWEALDRWSLGTTVVAPRQRDLIVSEDGGVPCLADPNDAAFIAASRTMLPAAVAAIEAVLFQCSGDGDNVYRDDTYGTGARVIRVDVIEAAITAALDVTS
jgi:hypothetical protein